MPIEFAERPTPARVPAWAGALLILSAAVVVVTVSRRAQERALILLGHRWSIRTGDADHVIDVRVEDRRLAVIRSGGTTAISANPKLTFDMTAPIRLPYAQPGENVCLRVEGGDLFIGTSWPQRLGSHWSQGDEALIVGQICIIAMTETEAAFATNGTSQRTIRFAALGHGPEKRVRLESGQWLNPLYTFRDEINNVEEAFREWGADTYSNLTASSEALRCALRECDVVHVAAHAESDRIFLANDSIFTSADLQSFQPGEMRCRLLVLSSCKTGRIEDSDASIAFQLTKRGVNLIASTEPLDDFLAELFFTDFYRAWLPQPRSSGIQLAAAIRAAADPFRSTDVEGRRGLDNLMLYGDPTLQLRFG